MEPIRSRQHKNLCQPRVGLRPAVLEDVSGLAKFASETFFDSYNNVGAKRPDKVIRDYIAENFSKRSILNDIDNSLVEIWVSKQNDEYVGYLKLDNEIPPDFVLNKNLMHLDRLYLDKNFQSQGIGKKYLEKCFEIASQKSFEGVWLRVWEENVNGIRFYEREGLQKYGQVKVNLEFEGFTLPLVFLIYAK